MLSEKEGADSLSLSSSPRLPVFKFENRKPVLSWFKLQKQCGGPAPDGLGSSPGVARWSALEIEPKTNEFLLFRRFVVRERERERERACFPQQGRETNRTLRNAAGKNSFKNSLGERERKEDGKKRALSNTAGEIELMVQWVYNPLRKVKARQRTAKNMFHVFASADSGTEDDGEEEPVDNDPKTKEEAESAAKAVVEANSRLKAELGEIEVKSGDYQIQVHVIEARELKAKDLEGTSDPVTYVECFGERFSTAVKPKCLSHTLSVSTTRGSRARSLHVARFGLEG